MACRQAHSFNRLRGSEKPMKKLAMAIAAIIALPTVLNAAPCKDAKGKFTKCAPLAAATHAPAAVATHAALAPRPAATHAAAARKAPCRDAKTGRFKKC